MTKQKDFYYKNNRLQQLRGLYYAVRMGSITKAAEVMGVSQTAVTVQIQSLERDLQVSILDRTKNKTTLTTQGKKVYEIAAEIVQSVEGLQKMILDNNPSKEIRIAAHHAAISYILPEYLEHYLKICPDTRLVIDTLPRDEAVKQLIEGNFDFILYPLFEVPTECYFRPTFRYEPVLLMHQDHPLAQKPRITPQDIALYDLIRVAERNVILPLFEEMIKAHSWKVRIILKNGNWSMLKQMVRANVGIALISSMCIRPKDQELVARSLAEYFPKMEFGIATKKGSHIPEEAKQLIKIIDASFFTNEEKI